MAKRRHQGHRRSIRTPSSTFCALTSSSVSRRRIGYSSRPWSGLTFCFVTRITVTFNKLGEKRFKRANISECIFSFSNVTLGDKSLFITTIVIAQFSETYSTLWLDKWRRISRMKSAKMASRCTGKSTTKSWKVHSTKAKVCENINGKELSNS